MPLLGQAAIVICSEMADAAAHDDWHSHEHLPERVAIPGFLRARRLIADDGAEPRILVIYEVHDAAVTTSAAYAERLNRPTPWSRRTMAANRGLSRTLCRIAASHGMGVGAWLAALPIEAPPPGRWVADLGAQVLAGLVSQPGLTGAHLLLRDTARERPPSEEERLRGRSDTQLDALLLLEGYDAEAARAGGAELAAAVRERGAAAGPARLHRLAHLLARDEHDAGRAAPAAGNPPANPSGDAS